MVRLLYAGNMGLGHELESIVRAVSKLNGQVDLNVLFLGNGKARRQLKRLTAELKLDYVKFHPSVSLYDLPGVLASGDIHLVSQRLGTEGLIVPSKIYGILAAGRPTVFIGPSDCEPAMIISKSQAGVIVQPGDIDGVADAIKKLAMNPDLRRAMGRRARQYYAEYFGRDRSVSRIIKTIESII